MSKQVKTEIARIIRRDPGQTVKFYSRNSGFSAQLINNFLLFEPEGRIIVRSGQVKLPPIGRRPRWEMHLFDTSPPPMTAQSVPVLVQTGCHEVDNIASQLRSCYEQMAAMPSRIMSFTAGSRSR